MSINNEIQQIWSKFRSDLKSLSSETTAIDEIRINYLGRKGLVANLFLQMGKVDADERPKIGKVLNKLKSEITLKIDGLSIAIMKDALSQAKEARIHILDEMLKALPEYRETLSTFAPKIVQSTIPVDNIGEFIGPGGKNIKGLAEKYECEINIDDDGSCTVLGQDQSLMDEVVEYIEKYSLELKPGESYDGEVVKIMDFGAFVKITPNKDGLLHISEIKKERINNVSDHLSVGDTVKVK